uniref:Endonuclease/exonuclease/phosphatase domain-containing protein n=1 Tax=Timema shepardi TaxID=629360 RepID=A0A7R9G3K1_TIMSH|nr:unnamed protein product [Timema shepardi]
MKLDVVCIQEPYTLRGKVLMVTRIVTSREMPMSAIVIFNRDITVTKITQLSNQLVTCVELGTGAGRVVMANLYFQFRHPIEPYLDQMEVMCRMYAGEQLIITADANAKSPMGHRRVVIRGDRRNDAGRPCRRGRALEEFIYGHGLEVVNQPVNAPTHKGRAGVATNIDVTLCNAESVAMVEGWRVVNNVTINNHNLIVFDITMGRVAEGNEGGIRKRYDMRRADWEKLRWELVLPDQVENGDNVNINTKELMLALQDVMRKSIPVMKGDTRVGTRLWNDKLQGLHTRVRRTRRRYHRCKDPVVYSSWENQTTNDAIYIEKRDDGSTTTNWEESAGLLMETLLPDDDEEVDTEEQRENFTAHIEEVLGRAQRVMNKIISIGQRRFHLPMRIIKTYHQVILLSIVGYGACVWAHRLNVVPARAVQSIQRNVLLRLTGAYRIDNAHLEPSPGLVQFITGKGQYPESSRKMGLVKTDRFECGEVGTPEHVVLECARTLEIRRPNQREVQGRLVGDILRDPARWRFLDKLAGIVLDRPWKNVALWGTFQYGDSPLRMPGQASRRSDCHASESLSVLLGRDSECSSLGLEPLFHASLVRSNLLEISGTFVVCYWEQAICLFGSES